jgi:Flp pilus assembly protein TadG
MKTMKSTGPFHRRRESSEEGVTALLVAITLFVLMGVAALAIDLSHLFVVKNELKNAADAGALAGARYLFFTPDNDGDQEDEYLSGQVNTNANSIAYQAAIANVSEKTAVEVNWPGGNAGDVQRGHWSFYYSDHPDQGQDFTLSNATDTPDFFGVSTEELDRDTTFVNAVRVVARREATPVTSFFARIFGYDDFTLAAESVAYIGFAGSLQPGEADQPIAICEASVKIGDEYECNVGRMINDGGSYDTSETGMWTNFSQDPPESCGDRTDSSDLRDIIEPVPNTCGGGNPGEITLNAFMSTMNGQSQTAFDSLRDECWWNAMIDTNGDGIPETSIDSDGDGRPDLSWEISLPVLDCAGGSTTCNRVIGAVTVEVVWISRNTDPHYTDVPLKMDNWTCSPDPTDTVLFPSPDAREQARIDCWDQFVNHFELKNWDEAGQTLVSAPYAFKSIYFKPSCDVQVPRGGTGGANYGVLAQIPVLVK